MENQRLGHTTYRTEYHITWLTKYRRPILTAVIRKKLTDILPEILTEMPGCEMVEYNILRDHIHMVIIIPPKYSVSEVIGRMKGMSSSRLRKRFSSLKRFYWAKNIVWSPGYFVSTVGVGEEKILSYVRSQ